MCNIYQKSQQKEVKSTPKPQTLWINATGFLKTSLILICRDSLYIPGMKVEYTYMSHEHVDTLLKTSKDIVSSFPVVECSYFMGKAWD